MSVGPIGSLLLFQDELAWTVSNTSSERHLKQLVGQILATFLSGDMPLVSCECEVWLFLHRHTLLCLYSADFMAADRDVNELPTISVNDHFYK